MIQFKLSTIIIPIIAILIPISAYSIKSSVKNKAVRNNEDQRFSTRKNHITDTILLVLMDFEETNLIAPIIKKLFSYYHIPVRYIEKPLPRFALFKQRNRYKADSLLRYLAALNNGHYRFVAGLTSKDISTTNGKIDDWGIFGLGDLSAEGCVTSSFRLKRNASLALLKERIQKVILHEIRHNYGLHLCVSPYPCNMKAANGKISELDRQPIDMCKVCRQRIHL